MKLITRCFLFIALVLLISCGGNTGNKKVMPTDNQVANAKTSKSSISQSLPTMMVIPSDGLLQRIGCFTTVNNQGKASYVRYYNKAFMVNNDLKFVIANIEGAFANQGYPIENMEQQLKQISDQKIMDEMEGVKKDLRTQLLNNSRPDYIIEVDYELKTNPKSRNLDRSLTYIVKTLDAYTNKAIASITKTGIGKGEDINDVPSLIKQDFPESISQLQSNISSHFADILANGTEITLRVTVKSDAGVQIDDYCGDEEIGEQIINWLKNNTVNSTYKMVMNTSAEVKFTNVRIYTSDEDGNSYTAYDFAKDLKKALYQGCKLDCANRTQSIGDAYLQIEGIR